MLLRWLKQCWPALIVGCGLGIAVGISAYESMYDSARDRREGLSGELRGGSYTFINPLLECEGSEVLSESLAPSKQKVVDVIADLQAQNHITEAAVYFRDLNNGPWFGINEREPFRLASLLKLPLMLGYLKQAEKNPELLFQKVVAGESLLPAEQFYKPSSQLALGKHYTIAQAIESMIKYSDNRAMSALVLLLGSDGEVDMYRDLGLPEPNKENQGMLSVKNYASFFRILFNASYLSRPFSEDALRLLSMTDFDEGLVAGVPKSIVVAHKFGESASVDGEKQLHDCGIVYYPRHPYLLCVMTRGSQFDRLARAIEQISQTVFEDVRAQKPER